jgi:hypothetical protein
MTIKKLQKTMRRTLIALAVFVFLLAFFWITGILSENNDTELCVRPMETSVLIPKDKTINLNLNTEKWNLEISQQGVIEIKTRKIIPLSEGKIEIQFKKKNDPKCIFVTDVFVIDYSTPASSGSGRL